MTIKKKLGLGVASAALGLSLIGGGTFAAFNDTATINNHFASGTLDLSVEKNGDNKALNFDISNMKPGDSVHREFKLKNAGTLAIKDVLLTVQAGEYSNDERGATIDEFLSQFEVTLFKVNQSNDEYDDFNSLVKTGQVLTLNDLAKGTLSKKIKEDYMSDGKINLAPIGIDNNPKGLTEKSANSVAMVVKFKEDDRKDSEGKYLQNKFMNNKVDFKFNLEATQWNGVKINKEDANGKINNGDQVAPGEVPAPKTDGNGKYKKDVDQ